MPVGGAGGEFFNQFIDEFFAEADEHLGTVRRVLLAVEASNGERHDAPDAAMMQQLLRALHTLKGLSGMVGIGPAEEVAHAMEDAARAVPGDNALRPELIEALFVGERLLETTIAARRTGDALPAPGPFVDRVRDLVQAGVVEPGAAGGETARGTGAELLVHFEFAPTAELAARGVGVELIRRRLGSVGEVISTVPRVSPAGGVTFDFDVRTTAALAPPEEWRGDGLSWGAEIAPGEQSQTRVVVHSPRTATTGGGAASIVATVSNVVRVDLARLDDLMRMIGDLVTSRARLGDFVARASGTLGTAAWEELSDANDAIEKQLRSIREGVMRVRLVAVAEVFERMRFAMRDIARETQKVIRLDFAGQDTEIDKLVVDRMLEPLLHLVRNAASHGIESRAERDGAGKPVEGTISLRARAAGDRVIIEVEDDGSGIDTVRVAARAVQMGLIPRADALTPDDVLDLISSPGFSTRDAADMASGRGVGMAVVRTTIRELGGDLFLDTAPGRGTRFTIELPLTLMVADALLVEIGDQSMAIPQIALREIVPLDPAAVTRLENNEVLSHRGRVIPLLRLATLFRIDERPGAARHVLIVGAEPHLAGLVVDRLIGLREIVIHPVTDPMIAVPGIAGATELADGRVSLILDSAALVRGPRSYAHFSPENSTEHAWP